MERREAEVAGTYNEQRAHPARAGHRSRDFWLTPAPREEGGERVCPQELHTSVQVLK